MNRDSERIWSAAASIARRRFGSWSRSVKRCFIQSAVVVPTSRDSAGALQIVEWSHPSLPLGVLTRTTPVATLDRQTVRVNHSHMSLASIQDQIKELQPTERAALIDLLWESLDESRVNEIEARWAAESEDRIDAFERGELTAVDGPSALAELRASLRK
jgi:putative addiction module component (TIGR02574 family)